MTYTFVKSTVDKIFSEYDKDRDGQIGLEEARILLNDTLRSHNLSEEKFIEGFNYLDKNQNGMINKKEMATFIYDVLTHGSVKITDSVKKTDK